MRLYGNIQKVDAEQRMVFGYASTEDQDAHGEVVLKSAIEAALDDYMQFANIREMHQLSAVGTAEEASVDDKGLYLGAKVVDDAAWGKVTSGVYKGFSVGGKVLARDPKNKKIITKILLTEISLVDRPSNPEARFDVWKAAGFHDAGDLAKVAGERDALRKALANRDVAIGSLINRVESTLANVLTIVAENERLRAQKADLTKRLEPPQQRPHASANNFDPGEVFAKVDRLSLIVADAEKATADLAMRFNDAAVAELAARGRRLDA